jgi:hypothetical protein
LGTVWEHKGKKIEGDWDVINMVETRLQIDSLNGWCYNLYFNKKVYWFENKNIVWFFFHYYPWIYFEVEMSFNVP